MLSILIPTYNYNIVSLVDELHKQCVKCNIKFEIIALDDKSSKEIISINSSINKLNFTDYELSKSNKGIAITRQALVDKASYNWVLLIDADMKLKDSFYISNYVKAFKQNYDVVFGGIIYENTPPDPNCVLRWKYGVTYEAINAENRNKKPYKITSAANILIKKNTYKNFCLDSIGNSYGMDIYFGPQLKLNRIPVLHIDNQVYHLGLESSKTYLKKIRLAVETLLKLHNQNKIKLHENDLLKTFLFLKKTRFNYILSGLYKVFKQNLYKHLISKNPKTLLLQFFKISYMCYYDLNKKN